MMKKCKGCGIVLQDQNPSKLGYTVDMEKDLCHRCFRIKHYNDYALVSKTEEEYTKILKEIDEKGELIVFVADLFLWSSEVVKIIEKLKSPILLVLSKRDVMPFSLKEEKIREYVKRFVSVLDVEIISSEKNFHMDSLLEKIERYKRSSYVYVVGFTNAGKSTLINKMIYNYSTNTSEIITSIMPSTTLDILEVPLHENLILMDTPGLIMPCSMVNFVDGKSLSKILPKKEIHPLMYPLKQNQFVYIEDLASICGSSHLTFYMSNKLSIERSYQNKVDLFPYQKVIKVEKGEDLVIEGLGFIKVSSKTLITVYVKYDVSIYTRKTILGG